MDIPLTVNREKFRSLKNNVDQKHKVVYYLFCQLRQSQKQQQQLKPNNMSNQIKVPYILECQVTGIKKSYTSVKFVENKIANYGGDEAVMIAGYVCRDAKKLLKAFKLEELTVENVQSVITQLGGTKNAQEVFDAIKSGKLFLKKMVKHREKPAAPATEKPIEPATGPDTEAPEQPVTPVTEQPVIPEPVGDKATAGAPKKSSKKSSKKSTKVAAPIPEAPAASEQVTEPQA